MSLNRLSPLSLSTSPSTTTTKMRLVSQKVPTSVANCCRVCTPYLPVVAAIAPNAPIGAARMIHRLRANRIFENDSIPRTAAAPALRAVHRGDADGDRAEDDRADDHFDQFDEALSERAERGSHVRPEQAHYGAEHHSDEDLDVEVGEDASGASGHLNSIGHD